MGSIQSFLQPIGGAISFLKPIAQPATVNFDPTAAQAEAARQQVTQETVAGRSSTDVGGRKLRNQAQQGRALLYNGVNTSLGV